MAPKCIVPDEDQKRLRALWMHREPDGSCYSTGLIGQKLGISKNAVVGRAHRMFLEPRPSPITRKREGGGPSPKDRPVSAPAAGKSTLPKLSSDISDRVTEAPVPGTDRLGRPILWASWFDTRTPEMQNALRLAVHTPVCRVELDRPFIRLWNCSCGATEAPVSWKGIQIASAPAARPIVVESIIKVPATPMPSKRVRDCCWPIGDPAKKDFRFCEDLALDGKSYCQTHQDLAFNRKDTARFDRAVTNKLGHGSVPH